MPDVAEQPVATKQGKSLLGFYIGLGVVAAFLGLGTLLWTPISIRYWEGEVKRGSSQVAISGSMGSFTYSGFAADAAEKLAKAGPRAAPAASRLLANSATRGVVLQAISRVRPPWALPVLAEACRREPDMGVRGQMVIVAQTVGHVDFGAWNLMVDAEAQKASRNFLRWWDECGREAYGGNGQ